MKRAGSLWDKVTFLANIVARMVIPPLYNFSRLERYSKREIQKNPNLLYARWFLAKLYKDFQRYEESKSQYLAILDSGFMRDSDTIDFAEVCCKLGCFSNALKIIDPILNKYPTNDLVNWVAGESHKNLRNYETATKYFERLINSKKRLANSYWNLGYCYFFLRKYEESLAAYQKALELHPEDGTLKSSIAVVHVKNAITLYDSNLNLAEDELNKAKAIDPLNAEIGKVYDEFFELKYKRIIVDDLRRRVDKMSP